MIFSFFSLILFIPYGYNFLVVPLLETYEWNIRNSNGTINKRLEKPSGIYSDLRTLKVLKEDIYYRMNDVHYRWVANDSWTYSVSFPIIAQLEDITSTELIFHGLDGISTIYLNKNKIGKTINSFVRYCFDITGILEKNNTLEIKFESPIKSGQKLWNSSPHPIFPSCVPKTYKGECHVNFLRRMQASFGWDWGPAFPSVGIWKPIELVVRQNDLILRDVTVAMNLNNGVWNVIIDAYAEKPENAENGITGILSSTLYISETKEILVSKKFDFPFNKKDKEVKISQNIKVPKNEVELWWPNGFGNQILYPLSTTIETSEKIRTTKIIKIGFRTAELIQNAVNKTDPTKGLSFYFSINGIPIFAKGSNLIPSNVLLEQSANKTYIRHLLESSKIANMNMLRVWGGGIYESDYFYEVCDELGIMIWQDMMFACSLYPTDDEFLSSVSNEISQQVRRLQHHASIVVWAGNNENEAALSGNWYGSNSNFTLFKKEYVTLYVHTVGKILQNYDKTRTYLTSSPTNGIESIKEGYVAKNPYDPLYGDIHFYNYYRNSWTIDVYPHTRFSSEYGYQSLPSRSTLQKVATNQDLSTLDTEFMNHRQHLPLGYLYLIYLLFFHVPLPLLTDLNNIIYLTQINQAWSVKSQTEWYRKWKSTTLPDGTGQTMGALYWQLNDVWQAPSWSSMEYGGKWKMLHYYAKHFFAAVLVTADLDSHGTVTINLISDLLYDILEAVLRIEVYKWDSFKPINSVSETVIVEKASSKQHRNTNVKELIDVLPECEANGTKGRACFLKVSLSYKNGSLISENHLFPHSFKISYGIQNVIIETSVNSISIDECQIKLKSSAVALFVWLDVDENIVRFSDNGFIMTQPEKEIIAFSSNIDCSTLQKSLQISVLDKKRLSMLASSVTELYLYSRFINPLQ